MAMSETTEQEMREVTKKRGRPKRRDNVLPVTVDKDEAAIHNPAKVNIAALQTKVATYEQLIQSYKARINSLENKMNGMVLEYNARLKYMKECIEHAYTSILFAENAAKPITKIRTEAHDDQF